MIIDKSLSHISKINLRCFIIQDTEMKSLPGITI